ncbi:MAG TPA: hypothetical protein VMZ29_13510 [Candidatus Bathyarchaeia archaeon]|nr:hypothetical protein [Candidatus Bathyarchaeia archaeon]
MFEVNYDKGREYLEKNGTGVYIISGDKQSNSLGSAYLNLVKEKLPEQFYLECLSRNVSFSKEFIKHYKVNVRLDLDRLMRACSILITNFTGPTTEDDPRNHFERIFKHFMFQSATKCENDVVGALIELGKIVKIPKKHKITQNDYLIAARIIGEFYKLWEFNQTDPFFSMQ